MITIKRTFCPGRGMIRPEELTGYVFSPEAAAHMFIITKMEKVDGQEAAVPFDAGTDISCRFIKANGVTELVDGDLTDDGAASITLPAECYQVPGRFILSIYAETSEETICIYSATATALAGDTDEVNVSSNTKRTIDAQIDALNDAVENAQEVIDSIPQDYTALSDSVSDLKSAVTETTRNLFDKYNPNSIGATFASVSGGYKITENGNNKMIIFPVTPGKTYTVSKVSSGRFRYGTFTALPAVGATMIQIQTNQDSLTAKTITMGANENYLAVLYYNSTVDTLTPEQILATLQVEEGSSATPYIAHMTAVDVTARNSAQTANSGIANIDAYIEEFTEPTWNLFDWQHPNIIEGNIASSSNNYIITTGTYKMFWLELEGNKWYMVQKKSSERFRYGLSATQPTISTVFTEVSVANDDVTSKIMYVPSTSKYLTVMYYSADDTLSEETILKSIMVTEGQTKPDYVPYLSAVDQYARRTIKNAGSGNLFAMFDNLTCIGDSLTYGEVFTGESAHRQANRTYPDVLAALSGNTAENLGAMGDSASDWWGHHGTDLIVKTNQLFIVYLGSNGGLTDTIDTDCQGTDIANYEPTNTGCYGKILQTALNVGARAVLVHIYGGGGDAGVDGTNAVIDKFGAKYGFPVLDNEKLTDDAYHYWPSRTGTNSLHYNDLGYAAFAGQLISAINALDPDEAVKLLAVD